MADHQQNLKQLLDCAFVTPTGEIINFRALRQLLINLCEVCKSKQSSSGISVKENSFQETSNELSDSEMQFTIEKQGLKTESSLHDLHDEHLITVETIDGLNMLLETEGEKLRLALQIPENGKISAFDSKIQITPTVSRDTITSNESTENCAKSKIGVFVESVSQIDETKVRMFVKSVNSLDNMKELCRSSEQITNIESKSTDDDSLELNSDLEEHDRSKTISPNMSQSVTMQFNHEFNVNETENLLSSSFLSSKLERSNSSQSQSSSKSGSPERKILSSESVYSSEALHKISSAAKLSSDRSSFTDSQTKISDEKSKTYQDIDVKMDSQSEQHSEHEESSIEIEKSVSEDKEQLDRLQPINKFAKRASKKIVERTSTQISQKDHQPPHTQSKIDNSVNARKSQIPNKNSDFDSKLRQQKLSYSKSELIDGHKKVDGAKTKGWLQKDEKFEIDHKAVIDDLKPVDFKTIQISDKINTDSKKLKNYKHNNLVKCPINQTDLLDLVEKRPVWNKILHSNCCCNALANSNNCKCDPIVCVGKKSKDNDIVCFCSKSFSRGNDGVTYHTICNCCGDN